MIDLRKTLAEHAAICELPTCVLCFADAELDRLNQRLNSPEIHDFADAIVREAAHQRERWGTDHDSGKEPEDWLWLVAFLATKAAQAHRYDDTEKYLHHIITAAAACCNWHAHACGDNSEMRAGPPEVKTEPPESRADQCGHMCELGYRGMYGMTRMNCRLRAGHDGEHEAHGGTTWQTGDHRDVPGDPLRL